MSWARWVIEKWPMYPEAKPPILYVGNRIISHGPNEYGQGMYPVPFKRQFFKDGKVFVWKIDGQCWNYVTHYEGVSERPRSCPECGMISTLDVDWHKATCSIGCRLAAGLPEIIDE